jgi:hypothetical protein
VNSQRPWLVWRIFAHRYLLSRALQTFSRKLHDLERGAVGFRGKDRDHASGAGGSSSHGAFQ